MGYVYVKVDGCLKGGEVVFDMVIVGGIENILMVVVLVEGVIMICNVVCEFEIMDFVKMLIVMGVKIEGLDIDILVVIGVEKLYGCEYVVVVDCIEMGLYLVVVVIIGGCVKIIYIDLILMELVLEKFEEMGVEVICGDDWIELDMMGKCLKVVSF